MKPERFRVNAMMGETEKEVLESLGGQTAGIEELVKHFLETYKIYERNKNIEEAKFKRYLDKQGKGEQ